MLVKATDKGYYNKAIVDIDTVFNYEKEGEIPVWVVPCEKNAIDKNNSNENSGLKVIELPENEKIEIVKLANSLGIKSNLNNYKVETLKAKIASLQKTSDNEAKLLDELEKLRTEALDRDIVVDIQGKSVQEEIEALKEALSK